jgi:Transglutaminase-like superfamily
MSPDPRSLRGRFRTLRKHVRSPSDALLVVRLLGWRVALAALKRVVPIETLVRWMATPGGRPTGDTRRIVKLVNWLYAPRRDRELGNCLDRSLVLYRFLSRSEPGTRLVLGMRRGSSELEGHAWVIAGDRAFGESAASGGDFVTLATFAADGRRVEAR